MDYSSYTWTEVYSVGDRSWTKWATHEYITETQFFFPTLMLMTVWFLGINIKMELNAKTAFKITSFIPLNL